MIVPSTQRHPSSVVAFFDGCSLSFLPLPFACMHVDYAFYFEGVFVRGSYFGLEF
jgi:hypothetical protein